MGQLSPQDIALGRAALAQGAINRSQLDQAAARVTANQAPDLARAFLMLGTLTVQQLEHLRRMSSSDASRLSASGYGPPGSLSASTRGPAPGSLSGSRRGPPATNNLSGSVHGRAAPGNMQGPPPGYGSAPLAPSFGDSAQGFGAPPPAGFGSQPGFNPQGGGFGAPPPAFGAPPSGFGAPPPSGFGAPPPSGFGAAGPAGFGSAAGPAGFGSAAGPAGFGSAAKGSGGYPVPITIVPGNLSDEDIAAIA